MIPKNDVHVQSGVVPGVDGVRFDYDEGFLTLTRRAPSGETETLFHGHRDAEGYFISADGAALARDFGRGVFINTAAVRRLDIRTATVGHAEFAANDDAPVANDNLKYCPPPTFDFENNGNEEWQEYQSQVTGLPKGWAVEYNHYKYDGCDEARRLMLEAKDRYAQFLNKSGTDWEDWFKVKGEPKLIREMQDQLNHGRGRIIEWHFSEKPVAELMAKRVKELAEEDPAFQRIIVVHDPKVKK